LPDGITKSVHRLNLQFDIEDESKFNERRRVATLARNEAKEQMRLDYYVDRQSRDAIRPVNKDSIRRIHTKVVEGLSVTVSPYSYSLLTHSPTHLLTHSLTGLLTPLLPYFLTPSPTHLHTHLLTYLLTHSLTYLLIGPIS
jgi:hypothetical protein